jgi:SAM-dependent methyltransferase
MNVPAEGLYTVGNALRFGWSSITGQLNPERTASLDAYVIGSTVLDAGCGGGAYVEYLARRGLEVTGCDKHEQFLEVASSRAQLGHYVKGDITSLEFPDERFDCTFCFDVLEHVDDQRAIRELARVTRQRLILAVPKEDDTMPRFNLSFLPYRDPTHLRYYTEESLGELVSSVQPRGYSVYPELAVPARELVWAMLGLDRDVLGGKSPAERLRTSLLARLLGTARYVSVYTGLVAVVDL